jgi:hypothetical protein
VERLPRLGDVGFAGIDYPKYAMRCGMPTPSSATHLTVYGVRRKRNGTVAPRGRSRPMVMDARAINRGRAGSAR